MAQSTGNSTFWIILLVIILIVTTIVITLAFYYHRQNSLCQSNSSPWCFTDWQCPPANVGGPNTYPYQIMLQTIQRCSSPNSSVSNSGACPFAF